MIGAWVYLTETLTGIPSIIYGLFGMFLFVGFLHWGYSLMVGAATVAQVPANLMESGRTLAIHMYVLSSEGLHTNQAFATAVVLLIMVIGINALAGLVARSIEK